MQQFTQVMFYKLYRLLSEDVYTFLIITVESPVIDSVLKHGLVALNQGLLDKASPGNRVRFLDKYVAALTARPAGDLVQNFFKLMCKKRESLRISREQHMELSMRVLEQRAASRQNVLSADNLESLVRRILSLFLTKFSHISRIIRSGSHVARLRNIPIIRALKRNHWQPDRWMP